MTTWFFIGIIAACLTIVGYIQEIVRIYRAKSAADVSSVTFLPFTLGISLWAVCGVSVSDQEILGIDTFGVLTIFVALLIYFHNQHLHRATSISWAEG